MSEMPPTMKIGLAAAFIGAIVAFIAMASAWTGDVSSAGYVGVDMAVAVVFFGVAGSFTTYSPVRGNTIIVLAAIAVASSIIGGICGAMPAYMTVILLILGLVCLFVANMSTTKDYVDGNRVI